MFRTEPVDVLARLKSNDRLALKELFQLYYGMVCKTIRRFIHDDALCEDLAEAQDACARWASQSSGQAPARFAEYEQLVAELADEVSTAVKDSGHRARLSRPVP